MRRPPLPPAAVAAAAALALLLAGCTATPDDDPAPPSTTPTPSASSKEPWRPVPGQPWQWQLSGTLDPTVDVPVYDIDGFDHSAATVADLHRRGRKVICYLSTGAWEDFRPDAAKFPRSVLGKGNGWEGERWLDIRRTDVLEPLMAARIDMCRAKGFDAVEPDNMDGYANDTGFPLTPADQLRYNRLVARLAHERGMSVALKNDLDQIPELVGDFDFAVNEQCAQYDECDALRPFLDGGKAVLHVEYELPTGAFCPQARRTGMSSIRKNYDLGAWRKPC
ncbi:endo alpha-1,4 polygalactosaminidase [Streptomyces sp. TRM64462]|uniref:endo alpha-1,4 polygalactosaminidase n=1 Tax=Streptomyces sp. TRM64462 TaxID=2741726 RepID=UPI001585EB10|nr:endo alpha-1,4 polygalactosaminidase [Streptomyces sp. TRM64462]